MTFRLKNSPRVALRKESVDRNFWLNLTDKQLAKVALRKESVDRNWNLVDQAPEHRGSLSARRAWIEIEPIADLFESVTTSLSARRAWIEIS